ncbi:hypothetical protein KC19_1G082800 [Ceratodon purpureus]|uniref:Uncharacterized protein n=1 Tax=Ceratodon purpureus TaxID=3225 RepID=A0A8T0J5N9_CERPU|nr:hypothetical protein KC19_1G082800 [Ceratodon purpureus]
MGWLWTCLGGGPSIQSKSSKAHRGKISNPPHDLRLHPLPTQLPRHGHGGFDPSHLQEMPSRGKCGEPDNMEAFKIPTTSVNTCISINTLKKASERSLESSFRREFGLSMRSDVDELKEELAALRRRLANEEAEAKKLREEVNYLRSCGVLQISEDSSDERKIQNLPGNDSTGNGYVDDGTKEKQRQGDIAPVKQLRKCFSGPMLFDVHSPSRNNSSESAMVQYSTQTRISSHRVGLSPKPHSFAHKAQKGEFDTTHLTRVKGDERVVASEFAQKISKVSLSNNLQHYPSTKVAAWTSQTTGEGHPDGMSKDLVILDSMDVHWIEVANAPCPSGFSTNVRRDEHHSEDHAESPRRSSRAGSTVADTSVRNSQKLIGKRRQSKRSMDLQEPTEKRSKEQSLVVSNYPPSLTPEQIEEQLSQAVAEFRQQKLELEAKHQASFCQGPSTSPNNQPSSNAGVVGFFRNSRKKPHVMRNRGFQRALSPVKEALSIEEITWSRQSSSRNESISAGKSDDLSHPMELGTSRFLKTVSSGPSNQGFKFSAQILEISPTKSPKPEVSSDSELDERPSAMENIAMVPIQCASPSLSPKKKSSSVALDALCALAVTSKTPAEGRYLVDDSVEGLLHEADWIQACDWDDVVEGMDIKPIECASPSFSDRRKTSRTGPVRQSLIFEPKDTSPLVASSNEFLDEVFRTKTGGKSTPSPNGKTPSRTSFRSPGMQERSVTPSPRKNWTPSPQKDIGSSPMINERSWYCDAIDAIQSINDFRSSKEGRLLTESVSLGNSPAGKTQRQAGPRNPHAFSAEKKILRRAFSWYVSEHDERMKTFGLKEGIPQREGEESEQCRNDNNAQKSFVPNRGQFREPLPNGRHPNPSSKKGVLHARRFSDSDSGGSATFSIDLTRPDSSQNNSQNVSPQNQSEFDDLDARDIYTSGTFLRERVDKENSAVRISQALSKNSILRTSDQSLSSSDSNKYLRRSQEAIPENRSVLGSVPFNHWDKSPTDVYSEDTRGERHLTSQRAGSKPSSRGVPSKILMRSRSFM